MNSFNLKTWQASVHSEMPLKEDFQVVNRYTGRERHALVLCRGTSVRCVETDVQISALQLPRRIAEFPVALRAPNLTHKVLRDKDCDEG